MEVNALETGVGHFGEKLKLHPVAFFSWKFMPAEQNYVGIWELLAVNMIIEEWKYWLEGGVHPLIVLTDLKNLEYLCNAKFLSLANPDRRHSSPGSISLHLTIQYEIIPRPIPCHLCILTKTTASTLTPY